MLAWPVAATTCARAPRGRRARRRSRSRRRSDSRASWPRRPSPAGPAARRTASWQRDEIGRCRPPRSATASDGRAEQQPDVRSSAPSAEPPGGPGRCAISATAAGANSDDRGSKSPLGRIEPHAEPSAEDGHRRQRQSRPAQLGDAAVAQPERSGRAARRPGVRRHGRASVPAASSRAAGRRRSAGTEAVMSATHTWPRSAPPEATRQGYAVRRHSAALGGSAILGAEISSLHTLMHPARTSPEVSPCRRPRASRIAGDRPVPHIVTELPGPKARAHVAFDETWTSPSLPRAYPIVPVRGEGLTVEDIDGNLFLDFAAGIAVNSTGHSHPQVVAAIKEQAAELIHFSASDFYLPIYPRGLPRARRGSPRSRAASAPTSATPAPRSSRRRSSSPATRRNGRTSSRSSARSTAGPTARSR